MGEWREAQEFLKVLLQWDYQDMYSKFQSGDGIIADLPEVPLTFKDAKEYGAIFESMMMEEALAQIMRNAETADVTTPQPTILLSTSRANDFQHVKFVMAEDQLEGFSAMDLVVLDRTNPFDEDNAAALQDHAIGACEGKDPGSSSLRVKFFLSADAQAGSTAGMQRVARMRQMLSRPMSKWWILKLSNMATLSREWAAVQRIQKVPMKELLLTGQPIEPPRNSQLRIPDALLQHMKATHNDSQMEAITAGMDGRPMILIQGPPGTGKTQTILALLSVLTSAIRATKQRQGHLKTLDEEDKLSRQVANWHLAAPWLVAQSGNTCVRHYMGPTRTPAGSPLDAFGLKPSEPPVQLGQKAHNKRRVLVCTPSNAALDEIALRVLQRGLLNGSAEATAPSIVRVGVTARTHPSLMSVTLDSLVKKYLEGQPSEKQEPDAAGIKILDTADVVFSTLAFSGSGTFRKINIPFDVVVIDEAAQALEPSSIVPLLATVSQVYMVGDPIQLPATVMSKRAVEKNYQQSLFKRLQDAGYPVNVLEVQYRMHPLISAFASATFYRGRIRDGPNVASATVAEHHKHPGLGPLVFYSVNGNEELPPASRSLMNADEASMVIALLQALVAADARFSSSPAVGVISPYKSQINHIKQSIQTLLPKLAPFVDVNTIDGFQGREKDVIIFSTVRTKVGQSTSIGFVADERRINVGLTRARCSLLVVGNRRALAQDTNWLALLRAASDNGSLFEVKATKGYGQFLNDIRSQKVKSFTLPPEEVAFFPSAEGDLVLPAKRSAAATGRSNAKKKRTG